MIDANNIIQRPISIFDPYKMCGVAPHGGVYDVAYICSNAHGKINIWSRAKPVRFDKPSELNLWKRPGEPSDFATVGFGLVIPHSWSVGNIHNYDYGYEPPRPGTDWCRLTDFEEYDHNAKPTDYVKTYNDEIVVVTGVSTGHGIFIELEGFYRLTADTQEAVTSSSGVDLNYVASKAGITNMVNLYPMVALSLWSADGSSTVWVHALKCSDTGDYGPLGNPNAALREYRKTWYLDTGDLPEAFQNASLSQSPGLMTVWLNESMQVQGNSPSTPWENATKWIAAKGELIGLAVPLGIGLPVRFTTPRVIDPYFLSVSEDYETANRGNTQFQVQATWTSQALTSETYYVVLENCEYKIGTNAPVAMTEFERGLSMSAQGGAVGSSATFNIHYKKAWSSLQKSGVTYTIRFGLSSISQVGPVDRGHYEISYTYQ